MSHIDLPDAPGIVGPMMFRPETAEPLNLLAEVLLRDPDHPLAPWERESIAARVSRFHYLANEIAEPSRVSFVD